MNIRETRIGFAAASFGVASALSIVAAVALSLPAAPKALHWGLLATGTITCTSMLWLILRRSAQRWSALEKSLTALTSMDWQQRDEAVLSENLPGVGKRRGDRIAALLTECLKQYATRAQDLEQSRAALEIRSRRCTAEAQRVASVFAALHEPVLVVDSFGQIALANTAAEHLLKLSGAEAGCRALAQLNWCEELVDLLTETGRRKGNCQRASELVLKDEHGELRHFRVMAQSLTSTTEGTERNDGVVAVLQDITQQKAAQKRNAEFVSAASHEMKTPLAGIKAYVELLVDGDAEDEATREEFLEVINGQANRLQRLIDNLLNLARIEAGVVSVNKQTRPLNEILEEAIRLVQPAAEQKQIELCSELSPLYLSVHADRDMLLQTALNLLSNAVKYTPNGGRVTLRSRMEDDLVRFEVEDTGVGLSSEDCQKVFEKFYRVKSQSDMAPGTGLGLPLAKHIAEEIHGGRMTLISELGKGSVFAVELPAATQVRS